ncbi:MAG: AraC family transcriptional regulator [Porticoccaceae bacterium]|nr:AraC family transcriptional regulator [Porticoccaceae bacterium]
MAALTDAGTLVRLAYQGLVILGVDADEVLKRSGLEPEKLYTSNLRTQFSAQPKFWQAAVELSGDPCIGLHIGEHMPAYRGQIVEYLFLSSISFGDGLRRNIRYQRLLSDALQAQIIEGSTPYLTGYFNNNQYVTSHLSEAFTLGVIKGFKAFTDEAFKPKKVIFRHSPNTDIAEYERIFDCEVEFNAKEFRLYFEKEILDYRSLNSAPELLNLHVKVAEDHMARLQQQDLIGDVNSLIASMLESGTASLETVAAKLKITPRQLRHQLKSADTSFQHLLNNLRHSLARRMLSKTDEDISEIVYLTGFSEPSTFYRAFKRWENTTPVEYRQRFRSTTTTA